MMLGRRLPSRSPRALGLRKVTVLVPEGCVASIQQVASELSAWRELGQARGTPQWRTVSLSAQLMIDHDCLARCSIRDTGAARADRFLWSVTLLGQLDPIAAGRAGEIAEARALAEQALGVYVAEWRDMSGAEDAGNV